MVTARVSFCVAVAEVDTTVESVNPPGRIASGLATLVASAAKNEQSIYPGAGARPPQLTDFSHFVPLKVPLAPGWSLTLFWTAFP